MTKGISIGGVLLSSWRAPTLSHIVGFWMSRKLEFPQVQPVRIKIFYKSHMKCWPTLNIILSLIQSYLSPETGSNEGSSATGASPTAHGVSDSLLVVFGCQDPMKRCLERTWQTWRDMGATCEAV